MVVKTIIGIDPGLNSTGWAIVQIKETRRINYLNSGEIKTNTKQALDKRLYTLYKGLHGILTTHKPDIAAVEETFVNKNPRSSLHLCHARGAILLTLSISDVSNIYEYTPTHIKKSITGDGHADKKQMSKMLEHTIKDISNITHDATDAIAIALCHAYKVSVLT